MSQPVTLSLSEGLVVAAVPAVSYVVAYRFETGYCAVFGIPTHLVEVGILNVFAALAVLIAGLSLVFWAANLLYIALAQAVPASPLRRPIVFVTIVSLYVLGVALLEWPTRSELIGYSLLLLLVLFFEFVFPIFTQRAKRGYLNKLAAQQELEGKIESLVDVLLNRMGPPHALVALSLALILVLAHAAGRGQARRQRDFLVPESAPGFVVLRQYGDRFVLGRLQEGGKSLLPEFRILVPAGEQAASSESFLLKRIGPLEPVPVPDNPAANPRPQEPTAPPESGAAAMKPPSC